MFNKPRRVEKPESGTGAGNGTGTGTGTKIETGVNWEALKPAPDTREIIPVWK